MAKKVSKNARTGRGEKVNPEDKMVKVIKLGKQGKSMTYKKAFVKRKDVDAYLNED